MRAAREMLGSASPRAAYHPSDDFFGDPDGPGHSERPGLALLWGFNDADTLVTVIETCEEAFAREPGEMRIWTQLLVA